MKIQKIVTMKTPLGINKLEKKNTDACFLNSYKNTVCNNVINNENKYSDDINKSNGEEFGFYESDGEFGEDDDDYDDDYDDDDDYIYPRRKKKPKIPALVQFGKDLTLQAKNGDMDLISGREKETNELIEVLCRRRKNNAVLIGEPGVGKTAVAEGLAQKIAFGYVPLRLVYKRVISLDLTLLIAGTRYRGEFEARMRRIIEETRKDPDVILFIDEMHNLIGAGAAEGAMDAANIFKPPLARGELQCIGATTLDEYKKYVERDPALQRRFQTINVCEPSVDQTFKILKNLRNTFEMFHDVSITDEGLLAAAEFSSQFIPDRFLPDKAIDLLDQASSRANLLFNSKDGGNRYIEYERESINYVSILKNEALRQGNLDIIRPLSNLEDSWRNELTKYMYLLEIKQREQDELIQDALETAREMPKFTESIHYNDNDDNDNDDNDDNDTDDNDTYDYDNDDNDTYDYDNDDNEDYDYDYNNDYND
jgi:ATP-dependent Clp protease ATP-binding subunit ClpA